jgi:hypothetical protein
MYAYVCRPTVVSTTVQDPKEGGLRKGPEVGSSQSRLIQKAVKGDSSTEHSEPFRSAKLTAEDLLAG